VAGWYLDFDVAAEDAELARDCFRILRRTCARYYLRFSYHEERRSDRRVYYMLLFDGRPPQLGLAAADFALEMHAVSTLQRQARRRQLPLRLLHWVTYSGSEDPIRLQPPSDRVPDEKREVVSQHLEEYALAWGAWRRDEFSPTDYLEAQHSLLTNLALDLAEGVNPTAVPSLLLAAGTAGGVLAEWFIAALVLSRAPGQLRCPRCGTANERGASACRACDLSFE
jgi:hypothetical protein